MKRAGIILGVTVLSFGFVCAGSPKVDRDLQGK